MIVMKYSRRNSESTVLEKLNRYINAKLIKWHSGTSFYYDGM